MTEQGPLSGQRLGDRYLLGALLGQGGFGAVYQAQHLLLNRPQAIKILLEQHFTSLKFRERFIREAQVLAKLDHPNIVHVDDFGIEGSRAYLVMPYIGGGTLQTVLKAQRGPLGLDVTWRYLEQICGALDYAHARNIAHLDLKPLNLLIHEDGRLLLSDFGLAHLMEQGAVEGGTSLSFGTPSYMAPEHFDGQPERRSDVYALGVILYQMLSGRLPFEGSTPRAIMMKLLTEAPPPLRVARPELPPALDDVLGLALAKEKEQRYQTAGELLSDFKAALAGRQTQAFSSGLSLANAPTRISQPQGPMVRPPNIAPLPETQRAANPPGVPLPPTLPAARPPAATSAITPAGPPTQAATPSGPQGAASNDQILRELEELKAAMRQLAQQPPGQASIMPASAASQKTKEQWREEGIAHRKAKRYTESLASFDQAISLDSTYADAYTSKSITFNALLAYDEALSTAEHATQLNPNDPIAYNEKGFAFRGLKRYAEALSAYEYALALDHNYGKAFNGKGHVLYDLKRYEEALAAFEQAIQLAPTDGLYHYCKGLALKALGRTKEEERAYQKARELGYRW